MVVIPLVCPSPAKPEKLDLHLFFLQHDSGAACTPGAKSVFGIGTQGNYIMYAQATSGNNYNNDRFSECSIGNISRVLEARKDACFVGNILCF